jgi:lysophospholipase
MPFDAQTLAQLRRDLPPLSFHPGQDTSVFQAPAVDVYLRHYGIDFSRQIERIEHYCGAYGTSGFLIASHYWLPPTPRGTVFVIHGYFDHVGLYGHLILDLLRKGYAVVAFDLPGHGLSDGERVTIASFDRYVDVFDSILGRCRDQLPTPWHAVGQSTGGAVLLKYVLEEKYDHRVFTRMALLAPLIHPRHWWANLLTYRLIHRFVRQIQRKFVANSADTGFLNFLQQRDPLQERHLPLEWVGAMKQWTERFRELPPTDYPLRIVQGDCDTTLDWRYNLRVLRRKLPCAEVIVITGAGHHLVNEVASLRADIFGKLGI